MNTTAKFTIASLATFLLPLSPAVRASSQSIALVVVLGAASTGQAATAKEAAKEADELLAKARQAMIESNFELADSYITRAEKLAPKYGMFHLGDTPKKVREDLQKRQAKAGGKSRGGLFGGKEPAQDPFAARRAPDPSADNRTDIATTSAGPTAPQGASPGNRAAGAPGSFYANGPAAAATASKAPGSFYGNAPAPAPAAPADAQSRWPAVDNRRNPAGAPLALSPAQGNGMNKIVSPERPAGSVEQLPRTGQGGALANGPTAAGKERARVLARQARAALVRGDLAAAEQLAGQASSLAPDSAFGPADDRPGMLLSEIRSARLRSGNAGGRAVLAAGGPTTADAAGPGNVVRSIYDPARDNTRNVPARNFAPLPSNPPLLAQAPGELPPTGDGQPTADQPPPGAVETGGTALSLLQQGEQALAQRDPQRALKLFQQAQRMESELDPAARASLQRHLQILQPQGAAGQPVRPGSALAGMPEQQRAQVLKIHADVARTQMQAKAMLAREPKRALDMLQQTRQNLETHPQLEPAIREELVRRVEMTINEANQYIQRNAAQIELDEKNRSIEQTVEADQRKRVEVDDRMAALVDEFNRLSEEQRYAEAELVAKRARAMDPDNLVVVQLMHQAKVQHRLAVQKDIYERRADGFVDALTDVERAAIPGDFNIQFPNPTFWEQLTKSRGELEATGNTRQSETERRIEAALKKPVLMKYDNRPIRDVMDDLARIADINIHLDKQGMAMEVVDYDTPVTINLSQEIPLKSALELILNPLRLGFVIKHDVLNITSGELTNTTVYTKSYPIGDLIIPIPNFVPDGREGISAALEQGYRRAGYGGSFSGFAATGAPSVVVADNSGSTTPVNPAVNAQWLDRPNSPPATGVPQQINFGGPGGLGGGSQADFDSLIDLITTTIAPTSWDTVGGPGSVAPFETNLTLVVSQTQEVHEQIADLLQQLRRLQDLQVTIEVRFINLSDNFFERIGVDFDFNIDDNFTQPAIPISSDNGRSAVIGLEPVGNLTPTLNLDLQFRQGSFGATLPNVPGTVFDPGTAGTFGFAILSDIEAFFLINAAQGDTRSNILQAPKITLFNGQTAFVSDTTQRPFVTSIIPVVGDFAAAHQPVIVVLSEGTSLSVQAIVSNDRRFVRLTLVPFFSTIGEVEEFTFTGSKTTSKKSSDSNKNKGDDEASSADEETTSEEGTTVQLPTFQFVTVTSTISVPDGGTVLLGGIKRLSEIRNERGLPILSKLPYINRLFKNVGIGRSTNSLMMMVTPRIIIQEEEEANLIGTAAP